MSFLTGLLRRGEYYLAFQHEKRTKVNPAEFSHNRPIWCLKLFNIFLTDPKYRESSWICQKRWYYQGNIRYAVIHGETPCKGRPLLNLLVRWVKLLYRDPRSRVSSVAGISKAIRVSVRVHQGGTLLPLRFVLVVEVWHLYENHSLSLLTMPFKEAFYHHSILLLPLP